MRLRRWDPFGWFVRVEATVNTTLALLRETRTALMAQLEDLVTALNDETNTIAARIDRLQADLQTAITNGQAPKPETLAALAALSDRLRTLGQDPTNPIPEPSPLRAGAKAK